MLASRTGNKMFLRKSNEVPERPSNPVARDLLFKSLGCKAEAKFLGMDQKNLAIKNRNSAIQIQNVKKLGDDPVQKQLFPHFQNLTRPQSLKGLNH